MSHRIYTPEFKDEAVRQVVERGYPWEFQSGGLLEQLARLMVLVERELE